MDMDKYDYIDTEFHTWYSLYYSTRWIIKELDFKRVKQKDRDYIPIESIYTTCIINLAGAIEGLTREGMNITLTLNKIKSQDKYLDSMVYKKTIRNQNIK